jgi:hypothetical protein
MSEHVPECWCANRCPLYEGCECPCRDCICSELRACEQRVLDTVQERIMRLPYEIDGEIWIDRDEVIGWIDKLRGDK